MNERIVLMLAALLAMPQLALPQIAWAQAHRPSGGGYAGQDTRDIKALSPQQIDDLNAGRGMGLALAAELNGYPGPLHVLELADRLDLSAAQKEKVTALFGAMKVEAQVLGAQMIAAEAALDRQFAGRSVTEQSLVTGVQEIALAQGALRTSHLRYHLATVEVLTPEQVARYNELRGYGGATKDGHRNGRH